MKLNLHKQIDLLAEVKMNDAELLKPNATTGDQRIDILLKRIQAGQPVELNNGKSIIIDKVKSKAFINILKLDDEDDIIDGLKQGNKYLDLIADKEGNTYKLTDLSKADYFGGGAGSMKPTATSTAHQESAQAMAIAVAVMLRRKLKPEDLTEENFKKAAAKYDVDSSVKDALAVITNPNWVKSLVNTTNELRGEINLGGKVIHRGSSWVKELEGKFNEVNKDEAGRIFPGKDKWNPADIWLVKKGTKLPDNIKNLQALNAWIEKMFEEDKIVGVSLKQTPKGTQSKIYNLGNDIDDLLNISITDLLVSKTNKLFRSKDASIMFEQAPLSSLINEKANEFVVRSFKAQDNVAGEISGRYAAGGKIGFGLVNRILSSMNLDQVTHRNDLRPLLDKKNKDDKEKYYKKIFNKIIAMAKTIDPAVASAAKKDFSNLAKTLDFNRLATKYQAVETLAIIKAAPKKKQEEFIQKVVQYASSRSDLSSVYIKVW